MPAIGDYEALRAVIQQFSEAPLERVHVHVHVQELGQGHIHQTFLVRLAGEPQLVLQRLNTHVFPHVDAVMENISRVTAHMRTRLERQGASDIGRRILTLRHTRTGKTHHCEPQLGTFRAFHYIERSVTLQRPRSAVDLFEAGRVCGEFARLLDDLPAAELHITLPGFHATELRFEALQTARASDPLGRASLVEPELRALSELEPLARECSQWASDPGLRLRVTHNDTKLDNILFDQMSHRALCLVDLDTVMPGYLAYDFGDLIRSCVSTADEDARDLSQVDVHADALEPLVRGYLSELAADLTAIERRSLARGPSWIVAELALRFLTDFLLGDHYFKTTRPGHNLDRARVQLALLRRLRALEPELLRLLDA